MINLSHFFFLKVITVKGYLDYIIVYLIYDHFLLQNKQFLRTAQKLNNDDYAIVLTAT